jgi:hypothetical protein
MTCFVRMPVMRHASTKQQKDGELRLQVNKLPEPVRSVSLLQKGVQALEEIDDEMGLAFDDWDKEYYYDLFVYASLSPMGSKAMHADPAIWGFDWCSSWGAYQRVAHGMQEQAQAQPNDGGAL